MGNERYERWGIAPGYHDYRGEWKDVPDASLERVLDLLSEGRHGPPETRVETVAAGDRFDPPQGARLELEEGAEYEPGTPLPPGYHTLVDDRGERLLVVSPGVCYLPQALRSWGWAVQLYAVRSRGSWGIGDLADLRRFGSWAAGEGAGMVLLNPLHVPSPSSQQEPSPYFPGSRCFRNPLYLNVEEVPGAGTLSDLDEIAAAGRALNATRTIDRDRVYELKLQVLENLWAEFRGDSAFDHYVKERGDALTGFSTFVTLAEVHEGDWRTWQTALQDAHSPEVERFRRDNEQRVRFHSWLQWLLEEQLAAASEPLAVVHDLAIGVDPKGADAWMWRDVFATGTTIGAPPDDYNAAGQGWGVLGFDPWKLDAVGYGPFVETLRASLRHAGGMRFDHVMGLFRLFWIPEGLSPAEGTYVSYRAQVLLDILALESWRAKAYVIGEDLGTVQPIVREEMERRSMLSYKVLWFEDASPADYPYLSLAAANNHDLPTTAGLWTGAEIATARARGSDPNEPFLEEVVERLTKRLGLDRDAEVAEVVDRSYEALAGAGSALVLAAVEDALEVPERHNSPGTEGPWNWSTALPLPLEEIEQHPRVQEVAHTMKERASPA